MADSHRVIDQFLGDATTPIHWASEEEKTLHFWLDDLHCPQPISPMWFDIGGWWLTCDYMYRRFGAPFGTDWVAKNIEGYVHSAVVPREAKEASEIGAYYNMVMPVYADKFLGWWKRRYLPEIERNFEYLDTFPMAESSLPELMILLEDAIDIQERHFRLHWMLNLAQFQASITFEGILTGLIGENKALVGRILVSDEDRNWDSVRDLWRLKEKVKASQTLTRAFDHETADGVMRALGASDEGRALRDDIDAYKIEYRKQVDVGARVHLSDLAGKSDADRRRAARVSHLRLRLREDVAQLRANRDAAIAEMWSLVPESTSEADRQKLASSLDLALKMTPLTPDHHFYMDQGHIRARAARPDGDWAQARRNGRLLGGG